MNNLLMSVKRWLATSNRKQKWTAVLTVVGLVCTIALLSFNGGQQTTREPLGSTPLYFAGAMIKLGIVLLLIVLSAVFARRWLRPGVGGKTVHHMHLMESVRLSPKQALHLVSVGDQQFLIGATDQNVALIAQVEGNPEITPVETVNVQPGLDFGSLLRSFNSDLPSGSSK